MTTSKHYWDVLTKKVFTTKDGEEKSLWFKAGNIKVLPDGKKFLTLFQQPDTDFYIFTQSEDEEKLPVIH